MTALGVSLLVIGAVVIVVEAHVPTLGMLGGPGVLALGVGAVLAVTALGGGLVLGIFSALVLTATAGAVLAITFRKGCAVRHRRVRTGAEGLIGHVGVVHSWTEPIGRCSSTARSGAHATRTTMASPTICTRAIRSSSSTCTG